MTNSNLKGKRGERAWRDELRDAGFEARRGQQYSGSPDSPDVVCPSLPGIHFEVKSVQRLNVPNAMEQAIRDAKTKMAVVAHKRNHGEWLITMRAYDWLNLIKETDHVVSVFCPKCKTSHVRKDGLTIKSQQMYECCSSDCGHYFRI